MTTPDLNAVIEALPTPFLALRVVLAVAYVAIFMQELQK